MFDRIGSGREGQSRADLERTVGERLHTSGWSDRGAVVVLDPELEVWVWSDSPHVDRALGWHGRTPPLRDWLSERGLWDAGAPKPGDPKRAVEEALRHVLIPRSSAI